MTSSNGNIFRVASHLCGEFIGHQWIPRTKASDAELWCFFDPRLIKRRSKQSRGWWFETSSRPIWRHCNVAVCGWNYIFMPQTGCRLSWSLLTIRLMTFMLCAKFQKDLSHCSDVIMGAMASQITSLMIVYSTVYSGTDQRKHEISAPLAFVRGMHRWQVNSPHRWLVTRKRFLLDDVIMEQNNGQSTSRPRHIWNAHCEYLSDNMSTMLRENFNQQHNLYRCYQSEIWHIPVTRRFDNKSLFSIVITPFCHPQLNFRWNQLISVKLWPLWVEDPILLYISRYVYRYTLINTWI